MQCFACAYVVSLPFECGNFLQHFVSCIYTISRLMEPSASVSNVLIIACDIAEQKRATPLQAAIQSSTTFLYEFVDRYFFKLQQFHFSCLLSDFNDVCRLAAMFVLAPVHIGLQQT